MTASDFIDYFFLRFRPSLAFFGLACAFDGFVGYVWVNCTTILITTHWWKSLRADPHDITHPSKASGVDNLPLGLLKDSAKEIAIPLTHIINLSISNSTFPTIWKIARVTPIYKSECTNDEANYQLISVLPILSRILEKAVYNQLSIWRKTIFRHNSSLDIAQNDPPKRLQFCFLVISVKTLKKEN